MGLVLGDVRFWGFKNYFSLVSERLLEAACSSGVIHGPGKKVTSSWVGIYNLSGHRNRRVFHLVQIR